MRRADLILTIVLMTSGLLGSLSSSAAQDSPEWSPTSPTITSFTLGVGDVVAVLVWKNPELAAEIPVRPDGRITLPLAGEVEVIGKTPLETQELLTERFSRFVTAPAVSVVVSQINSRKIFILGEVGSPGVYDLMRPTRLVQALAMAGGLSVWARDDEVVILRETESGREERKILSVKAIATGRRLADNIILHPGDTIIVP